MNFKYIYNVYYPVFNNYSVNKNYFNENKDYILSLNDNYKIGYIKETLYEFLTNIALLDYQV